MNTTERQPIDHLLKAKDSMYGLRKVLNRVESRICDGVPLDQEIERLYQLLNETEKAIGATIQSLPS